MGNEISHLSQEQQVDLFKDVQDFAQSWVDDMKQNHTILTCLGCDQEYDCSTAVVVNNMFQVCPSCAVKYQRPPVQVEQQSEEEKESQEPKQEDFD